MLDFRLKFLLPVLLAWSLTGPAAAAPWLCTLPDSLVVPAGNVTLRDLSTSPVPSAAARILLVAGGQPGTTVVLDRRTILRRLVSQRLAGGVGFRGADTTVLVFRGRVTAASRLQEIMKKALEPYLPDAAPGAPATWLELQYTGGDLGTDGEFSLTPMWSGTLRPGRQAIRFGFQDGGRSRVLPVAVIVHHFAQVARSSRRIPHGARLEDGSFTWEWVDLADGPQGRVTGRRALSGLLAARTLEAGSILLEQDLKSPPVILAGDPVELKLGRGGVLVSVRAYARREGSLGQTIPVKNQLTGQLVNARVAGPGVVEWRY